MVLSIYISINLVIDNLSRYLWEYSTKIIENFDVKLNEFNMIIVYYK